MFRCKIAQYGKHYAEIFIVYFRMFYSTGVEYDTRNVVIRIVYVRIF